MASSSSKRAEGMVFVAQQNMIVEEAVGTRLFDDPPKREPCEITVADFDGAKLKVVVLPDQLNFVTVHVSIGPIGQQLKAEFHGDEIMELLYPGMQVDPEAGYDVAVGFDLDNPPGGDPEAILDKICSVRSNLMGAPLYKALLGLKDGSGAGLPLMAIPWRTGESMFIKPAGDRCTIVYAINFPDETDRAIARVMLQQFAKEGSKVNGAPPCSYAEADKPPMEIRDLPGMENFTGGCGFLTFVVFPAHISSDAKFDKSVRLLSGLRTYLHYHIKTSKTYLHMRMRRKVQGWLQVLNRAVHEQEKEAKTASGKSFKRAGAAAK